jgi:hypothetical protein
MQLRVRLRYKYLSDMQVHPGELSRVNSDSALPVTERGNEEDEEDMG